MRFISGGRLVRETGIEGHPMPPEQFPREDTSWEVGQDLLDLFTAQNRGVGTPAERGKAGDGVDLPFA